MIKHLCVLAYEVLLTGHQENSHASTHVHTRVMQHWSICTVPEQVQLPIHRQRAAVGSTSAAPLIIAYNMTICFAFAREYTTVGKMQHLSPTLDGLDRSGSSSPVKAVT